MHNLVSTDLETFKEYHGPIKTKIETYLALLRKTLPDLKALEMSGPEGSPIPIHNMTDADLANRLLKHLQEQHTLEGQSTDITPPTPTHPLPETQNLPETPPSGVPTSLTQQGLQEDRAYPGTEEGPPSALHPPIQNSPSETPLSSDPEEGGIHTVGEVNQAVDLSTNTEIANGAILEPKPSKTKLKKSEKLKGLEDML